MQSDKSQIVVAGLSVFSVRYVGNNYGRCQFELDVRIKKFSCLSRKGPIDAQAVNCERLHQILSKSLESSADKLEGKVDEELKSNSVGKTPHVIVPIHRSNDAIVRLFIFLLGEHGPVGGEVTSSGSHR